MRALESYETVNIDDRINIKRQATAYLLYFMKRYRGNIKSILEVGVGSGISAILVKKEFPLAKVAGLDNDGRVIEHAQKSIKDAHVDVEVFERDMMDIPGKHDLIFSYGLLNQYPERSDEILWKQMEHARFVFAHLSLEDELPEDRMKVKRECEEALFSYGNVVFYVYDPKCKAINIGYDAGGVK